MHVKQGDVFLADMGEGYKAELKGKRPVLVVSNDSINKASSTVIVAMISGSYHRTKITNSCKITQM